jgi:hypothetical protein
MPTQTYTPIARQVLTSSQASVTFSSIPSIYTDLVLVTQSRNDAPFQYDDIWVCFNSDTTNANYSVTRLSGDGTSATSNRSTAANDGAGTRSWILSDNGAGSGIFGMGITHIMNYANTTTFKTGVSRSNTHANESVRAAVGLWRNTAAINTIKLSIRNESTNFISGCTFTLYGIKAGS